MKAIKALTATLCMLLLALALPSCSDDKDDNEPTTSDSSIVGHWLQVYDTPLGTIGMGYTFEANGTGYMEANVTDDDQLEGLKYWRYDFTYSCKNGSLTIKSSQLEVSGTMKYSVKSNILYLTSTDEDGEEDTGEFKKYPTNLKDIIGK